MKTDTAHLTWNSQWADPESREEWQIPDPDVIAVAERLANTKDHVRVLDLGCGVGRHALHFARRGFETLAVDMAAAGVSEVTRVAAVEGLSLSTQVVAMTDLPFPDWHFDYLLSFNVIYHGDEKIVRRTLSEIRRVLKPGGIYQSTMLSKRNDGYGKGREISPNTFVCEPDPADAHDSDKVHPHFYCNAAELVELLEGFELLALKDEEQRRPGHWHWHLTAERLG